MEEPEERPEYDPCVDAASHAAYLVEKIGLMREAFGMPGSVQRKGVPDKRFPGVAFTLLADTQSIIESIESTGCCGSRRIIDNLVRVSEILDQYDSEFARGLQEQIEEVAVAASHYGFTIDGFDVHSPKRFSPLQGHPRR